MISSRESNAKKETTRSDSTVHVLFVDDEPNMLEVLRRMLTMHGDGWQGEGCLSVDEALEALHRTTFDIVVADIRMPKKDGFALIEAMRSDDVLLNIPIIVLTGEADRTLKRRVLDVGGIDLLNKPVSWEDLTARLRSALRLKRYQDQLQDEVRLLDDLVQERTRQVEKSHRETIWRLAKAGEFRDDQTGSHVARVAWTSRIIAEGIGMKPDLTDLIFQTSPLHDIGKIGIPDAILLKPAKLTPEERKAVELHVVIGEEILRYPPKTITLLTLMDATPALTDENEKPIALMQMAGAIARHHHEKWDGSGYPDGLAGPDIPMAARIVALADVYDALLSERPYKAPVPQPEALATVRDQAGSHFDSEVVEAFFAHLDRIDDVYERFDETLAGLH